MDKNENSPGGMNPVNMTKTDDTVTEKLAADPSLMSSEFAAGTHAKADAGEQNEPTTKPFGDWLKNERAQRKISLEEIAAVTKVHILQLRALEENDIGRLPAPAFVRGFLVSYARHLGIDENEVLERYKASFGTLTPLTDLLMPNSSKAAKSTSFPKVRIVTTPHIKQSPSHREAERSSQNNVINLRNVMIFAGVAIFAILLITLMVLGKRAKSPRPGVDSTVHGNTGAVSSPSAGTTPNFSPTVTTTVNSAATATALQAQTSPAATNATMTGPVQGPVASTPPKEQSSPKATSATTSKDVADVKKFSGEVRALEQSWLNVRIDDGESKGTMLKSGGSFPFEAGRRVTFSFSDAGSIEIKWNGIWYLGPGSRGDVKTLTLPEQLATLSPKTVAKVARKPKVKAQPVSADPTEASPAESSASGTEKDTGAKESAAKESTKDSNRETADVDSGEQDSD